MNNKSRKKISKLKLLCFLIVVIVAVIIVKVRFFSVENIVVEGRENWDIFSAGDTAMSGEFAGKIYEKNYTIDTLPDDYVSSLIVDYYLATTSNFYVEENQKEDLSYHKVISKEELNKLIKDMFGPDNKIKVVPVEYGCGRFLKIVDNTYIIGSNDPDACGVFNNMNSSRYISFVRNYQKYNEKIIIDLKIAYIAVSREENDEGEETIYNAYTDNKKMALITSNYNPACLNDEGDNESCYKGFINYQVILKKASNHKYYFYSISKQ